MTARQRPVGRRFQYKLPNGRRVTLYQRYGRVYDERGRDVTAHWAAVENARLKPTHGRILGPEGDSADIRRIEGRNGTPYGKRGKPLCCAPHGCGSNRGDDDVCAKPDGHWGRHRCRGCRRTY